MKTFTGNFAIAFALILALSSGATSCAAASPAKKASGPISLPEGFSISAWADDAPNARSLTVGDEGTVFVGTRAKDVVYALKDEDGDGVAELKWIIASGLNSPNGVAFKGGSLYVAEIGRILRYDGIESRLNDPPAPVVVFDKLPTDAAHGWKYIAFGPDGMLYIPVGAPCNVCDKGDPYASIHRINPDGSGHEIFARGIRNTVGFDWNPETGVLWFTDNGRDWLGDDLPPEELNRAPEAGLHFGFPYRYGDNMPDPEFGDKGGSGPFAQPEWSFQAHTACLGMEYYQGGMFPARYRETAFVAQHGSWNRSSKVGYRVMTVTIQDGKAVSAEPFAEGWLKGEKVSGRPVDFATLDDGSLLISDDYAGKVYRVAYGE